MKSSCLHTYLFAYQYRGATYGFDVKAASPEDAKRRVTEMANARYDGELVAVLPCGGDLMRRIADFICSLRATARKLWPSV